MAEKKEVDKLADSPSVAGKLRLRRNNPMDIADDVTLGNEPKQVTDLEEEEQKRRYHSGRYNY